MATAMRSSCFMLFVPFFLLLGVGWLTPLLEDDEGRKAGWNRKEMEKERYDIILRSGLLWNQGVYSGQRFPVMGTGEEEKSGEEKSKKTRTKRFGRADLMQQQAVARRVRLSLLPHYSP